MAGMTVDDTNVPFLIDDLAPELQQLFRSILQRTTGVEQNMTALQETQLTVQQSLNLIQAAHNILHERMQSAPDMGRGNRRVMDGKFMIPTKF